MEETTNVKAKKKIKTKDLVFVGVFVALYLAVMMVVEKQPSQEVCVVF